MPLSTLAELLGSQPLELGLGGQAAQRNEDEQRRLAKQQGAWQTTPQEVRKALKAQRSQQSGLLNQSGLGLGLYEQVAARGAQGLNDWWSMQATQCKHEITELSNGIQVCKFCGSSAVALVAKALKRKKHD